MPDAPFETTAEADLAAEPVVRRGIELLFFAYRDFTAPADALLARYGFGRAHHRALYFIGRHPGATVSDLLSILRITKQSLARVLKQLVDDGLVAQAPGARDRRQRRLTLTAAGAALERDLFEVQRARIGAAYAKAGTKAVSAFHRLLMDITDEKDRFRAP